MLDRLISGAGAVTDAADRSVRSLGIGWSGREAAGRPGSLIVAGVLALLSGMLVLAGFEATDPLTPVPVTPAQIAAARDLGDRTYSTITGSLSAIYVEAYADDETAAWYYFLIDPVARTGVTVRSTRPPEALLTYRVSGLLRADPGYAREVYAPYDEGATRAGLKIEGALVLDASAGMAGPRTTVDLSGPLPAGGSPVEVTGAWLGSYLGICGRGLGPDQRCDPGEEDRYEIVVFDPTSRRAIRVLVRDVPEFGGEATFTGSLHRAERIVEEAKTAEGNTFSELDLHVSDRYVLEDAQPPASAPLAFALAVLLFAVAGVIVIGLASGYLIYRRTDGPLPSPATTLATGEGIPVRITGLVRTPTGVELVREAPGDLIRFLLGRPIATEPTDATTAEAESEPMASTLVVQRAEQPHGINLGHGDLTRLTRGRVMTFRAPRPAIRVTAGTGAVLLSFDSEADRDRAIAELLDESGLASDGQSQTT
jgi:hypothetical protein